MIIRAELDMEKYKAILLLILTALLWSLGGLFIKIIDWNPVAIAGTRSIIASIVILPFTKKERITFSWVQLSAAIAYAGTVILFVLGNKMTTAANTILLQYTAPIYVVILSKWFLKEKNNLKDYITVIIVIFGMSLFFIENLNFTNIIGNIIAALSGISFAFFTIFMRMQKKDSPLESVFLGNLITGIICLPFIFKSNPTNSGWMFLILLGVIQLGIPYILYSKAIKHVTALDAILIPVIEPLLNPIWVFLLLGEIPGIWALVGGLIIITTVTSKLILPIIKVKPYKTTGKRA